MTGSELAGLFLLMHAIAQYVAWRLGGTAILPWIIYRPLTLAVILSNSAVFLYSSYATRKICEDAVNDLRQTAVYKGQRASKDLIRHSRRRTYPISLSRFVLILHTVGHALWRPWNVTELNDSESHSICSSVLTILSF
ncbi:hypothetical protein BC829DRAFT_54326 [Chytridium lagenaria]|nr:hypothetical protein BC829DRAFT_54326 [Chytridium lagenaria]